MLVLLIIRTNTSKAFSNKWYICYKTTGTEELKQFVSFIYIFVIWKFVTFLGKQVVIWEKFSAHHHSSNSRFRYRRGSITKYYNKIYVFISFFIFVNFMHLNIQLSINQRRRLITYNFAQNSFWRLLQTACILYILSTALRTKRNSNVKTKTTISNIFIVFSIMAT